MRVWRLGAVAVLAAWVAGCGTNATPVGVVVSPTTANVIVNGTQQFIANVTGSSTNLVTWQICLPAATTGTKPTNCSPAASGQTALTGFGSITPTGLYTAPATPPSPNNFLVVATAVANTKVFAIATVTVDSGIRVQLTPTSATIGTLETFQFTATVTGTANKAVAWAVNNISGGDATVGFICPNSAAPQPCAPGEYVAPATSPGTVTVTATSSADSSHSASASVTVSTAGDPTVKGIDPTSAAQGSVQQDVYLTGTNFLSTSTVELPISGVLTPVPTTFVSTSFLRATIPAAALGSVGTFQLRVMRQNGDLSPTTSLANLTVVPVRPAIVSSSPDSITQNASTASVNLTGGFFAPSATTVQFNGQPRAANFINSRQLNLGLSSSDLATPGLYPIVVESSTAAAAGVPSMAAINLAVTPTPSSIPTAALATIGLAAGAQPSAVAIDKASNIAVVVNTGNNTITLIDLATNTAGTPIAVGNHPTSVAIDDLLSPHLALVVNSADDTISVIDLSAGALRQTVDLSAFTPVGSAPFSIGINPLTHRAFVANQSTNEGTVIDLVTPNPNANPPCTTPPCPLAVVGGSLTPYSTGPNPAVAIDSRLNWAVITPGGAGTINLVDLGRDPSPGDGGRAPLVIGSLLTIGTSTRGIGINGETHQVLLTDPNAGNLTSFSLADETVNPITFTSNGTALTEKGFVAAAANPLTNVGVAVNENSATAAVVDLKTGMVLQMVTVGNLPQAVAVDPASNEAVVVNQADDSVSIISLGSSINPLQIVEASPAITFTSTTPLMLTVTGSGFVSGSQVMLDGTPVGGTVLANGRQIVATVPANMLSAARNYAVSVQNPGSPPAVSNATDLTVIQPVFVGTAPVGVAVGTFNINGADRDLAVVTNSADNTVSLVDLTTGTTVTPSPVLVGANPQGVAVIPRLGLAAVANNGSNDVSIIDVTGNKNPQTVALCSTCSSPVGVAINQDTATAVTANSGPGSSTTNSTISFVSLENASLGSSALVDQNPTAVAVDPTLNLAAVATDVATSPQTQSVDIVNMSTGTIAGRAPGMQIPSGIVFDPVNQVFVVANSAQNNVVIVDPSTFIQTPVRVGINPTSVDYSFQTSTLVTVNSASHTMSMLDYLCPPTATSPNCPVPHARTVLGLGGSQPASSVVIGPNAIAIDARLNLAVLVDQNNNRVLLVPLPH